MISITVKTNGKEVLNSYDEKDVTLSEVGVVLVMLKQIEHELLSKEFGTRVDINGNGRSNDDDSDGEVDDEAD